MCRQLSLSIHNKGFHVLVIIFALRAIGDKPPEQLHSPFVIFIKIIRKYLWNHGESKSTSHSYT